MNSKDIKGVAVIDIADGKKLGNVDHVYVDPEGKRVVAFAAHQGGGLLVTEPEQGMVIGADEVHSLGPDALTLTDAKASSGTAIDANPRLVLLSDLGNLKIVTEGGTFVGQVASTDFDERTFALTRFEASPGFFKANTHVPIEQVLTIGEDVVVVTNDVLGDEGTSEAPAENAGSASNGEQLATANGVTVHEGRSVVAGEGLHEAGTMGASGVGSPS